MIAKSIKTTFRALTRKPVLWLPGVYAGVMAALLVWLEFSGYSFIASKIFLLALIAFPIFLGMVTSALAREDAGVLEIIKSGARCYFPVILPYIIVFGMIILLALLFTVPLAIMGFGDDPAALSGLMLGICIPALIFSLYADNVAVIEKTRIFPTLKRSLEVASRNFTGTIGYIFTCIIGFFSLLLLGAVVWGVYLAEKFVPYAEMNATVQQETFGSFTMADWQALIGPEGVLLTALLFGLGTFLFVPFMLVLKYYCYAETPPTIEIEQQHGEYDEKGRWYKY